MDSAPNLLLIRGGAAGGKKTLPLFGFVFVCLFVWFVVVAAVLA